MKAPKAAIRFAQSLLSLSLEKGVLEEAKADMEIVRTTCAENHELELLLQSPIIKSDKKKAILTNVFENAVSALSLSFIQLITTKGRENILPHIAEAFISLYKEHKGIITVEVTSASPLTTEQKTDLIGKLSSNNSEIELIELVKPEVIGGVKVRVGDLRLDATIQKKIHDLKFDISK